MELEVKRQLEIEEGKHKGTVSAVTERTDPYHYIDIFIKVDGQEGAEIKYGVPANVTPNSKLGRLIERFSGQLPAVGTKVDPEQILLGKRVTFVSVNEEKEKGTFAKVTDDSLKPLREPEPNKPEVERKVI